jgi:glucose/arabinose dehydrogenase
MIPMIPFRRAACVALVAALAWGCGQSQPTSLPGDTPSVAPTQSSASASPLASPTAGESAPPTAGPSGAFDPNGLSLSLEPIARVPLTSPLAAVSAFDGSGRVFVVEQGGTIRIVRDGALLPDAFLDLSAAVSRGGEQGLLGLAFHPDYPDDPRFFVDYTDQAGDTHVSSFTFDPANPDRADPRSEVQLLFIAQPYANHNGGVITFGPDGYLYIGSGDGGSGGDPHGNGQKLGTLLGKVLRIDVDGASGDRPYGIPSDNPFVNTANALPEILAIGLRNPWRLSFDRQTGDLWVGDVGQNNWEEIDVARAGTSGQNFGWNRMEGAHCFRPAEGCDQSGLTMPITEYSHTDGCTVIGGHVYRGSAQPALSGGYVFADYCSGKIWAIDPTGEQLREPTLVAESGATISSFGEDEAGELYVTGIRAGQLLRVVASRG